MTSAVQAATSGAINLTSTVEILTAIVLGGSVIGGGFKAMARLTRIADGVERLSESMEHVVQQIGDHEMRLTRVEDRFADLHDDVRAGRKGIDASGVTGRAASKSP